MGQSNADFDLIGLYLTQGNLEKAREYVQQQVPDDKLELLPVYMDAQTDPAAREVFLTGIKKIVPVEYQTFLAEDYARFGMLDEAFEILDNANLLANDTWYLWDPSRSDIRKDPRFVPLMEKAGLIDYWDADGWPPHCSREAADIVCN